MDNIYTEHNIKKFFGGFKSLQNAYNIEKVHQLINNPNAKATHGVNLHLKHLKTIIMTSALIIGITSIVLWFNPKETNKNDMAIKPAIVKNENTITPNERNIINDANIAEPVGLNEKESRKPKKQQEEMEQLVPLMPISYDSLLGLADKFFCKSLWSSDTILDKENMVIHLSDEELLNIGVVFKKDTLIIINDTILKRGVYRYSRNFYQNNLELSGCSIIPEYLSTSINHHVKIARPSGLYNVCDTLLPVVLGNSIHVLWYNGTPEFFNRLPKRYKHLEEVINNLKQLKSKNPDRCFVNFFPTISDYNSNSIKVLKLPREFFIKLGIVLEDTIFSMEYPENGISYTKTRGRNRIYMNSDLFKKFPDLNPVFITDEKGNIEYNLYMGDSVLNYDIIIPVLIDFHELINRQGPSEYWIKKIFWYYPTDNFIAALPEEFREELKLERDNILSDDKNVFKSCTYFEVCKSTLQFQSFKLYPNPVKYSVTLEFDISDEIKGSISIVNIAGIRLKTLIPNSTFLSGHNTYQMDLSGITPGIYFISINTDKGFKTQRLIISQ